MPERVQEVVFSGRELGYGPPRELHRGRHREQLGAEPEELVAALGDEENVPARVRDVGLESPAVADELSGREHRVRLLLRRVGHETTLWVEEKAAEQRCDDARLDAFAAIAADDPYAGERVRRADDRDAPSRHRLVAQGR